MNKLLLALLASALSATTAHADDLDKYYAGLTLASGGDATAFSRTGERVRDRGGVGAKVFGGINFSKRFALEAGYGNYGTLTLENTGAGTSGDARIDTSMMYIAGKGTLTINDSFALFGKAGVARTRFALSGFGQPDVTMTRPMLGVGAQYKLSKRVALTLEYENFGKTERAPNQHYNLNKFEAGVRFSF